MEIQQWREFLIPYEQAVQELVIKFQNIIREYTSLGQYSPIEQVNGRVKKISSILEKVDKKNMELSDVEERIEDIAGVRIICQFVEDIGTVVDLIRGRQDMEIIAEINYVAHKKASGYRSYHIIVKYPVQTVFGRRIVKAEIQIRTLAMNFWATIEHSLRYQYQGGLPQDVQDRLHKSAEAAYHIDREMSSIRSEIIDAQEAFKEKSNLVGDILSNIENIYLGSEKIAMREAQAELFELIRENNLDKMRSFGARIDDVAQHHGVQSLSDF